MSVEVEVWGKSSMSVESHLRHKEAQLSELKDALIRGEISYRNYEPTAVRLVREIRELQSKVDG